MKPSNCFNDVCIQMCNVCIMSSCYACVSGAPEPICYLFIYRVFKETYNEGLHCFITEHKFTVRDRNCISNPDAKFDLFRLSVPMS